MTETEQDIAQADDQATGEEQAEQLTLEVKVETPSSCERHVTVTVSREDIDRYFEKEFDELAPKAEVPGFRPGRAPRKLVVNRYKEQIGDQVKGKLLMDSMAQVSDTHEFSAISEPDFDLDAVKLPDDGPMTFEFDLEVRPEFEVPEWKGLSLEQPVSTISDEDVDTQVAKLLRRYATLEEIEEGAAEGDFLTINAKFSRGDDVLSTIEDRTVELKPKLSLRDSEVENFGELFAGAKAGEAKTAKITLSDDLDDEDLKGQEVDAAFEVTKVERVELPKLTSSFLDTIGGFVDEDDLKSVVREEMERQQRYRSQQEVRRQITKLLIADANWELPKGLLRRQSQREMRRMVLELQASGFSPEVVQAHANQLQRNSLAHTAEALKEHFILERIAEVEKIDAEPDDFDHEIELIAEQNNSTPRRIRARLEKRGEMDSLRNQIIERKVIELITSHASVNEVEAKEEVDDVSAIDHAVVSVKEEAEIPEAKHGEEAKPVPGK